MNVERVSLTLVGREKPLCNPACIYFTKSTIGTQEQCAKSVQSLKNVIRKIIFEKTYICLLLHLNW